jgi:hypothetical protein
MIDSIGDLWQKIAELDEQAKVLRRESNEIVGFVPGNDGVPQQQVSDPIRFKAIGEQFKQIAVTKAYYESKLAQIKELIGENGDGCLARLSGYGSLEAVKKLRVEMKEGFVKLMGNYQHFKLPSEVMETDAYKELSARIEPEIRRLEAKATSDRLLSEQVMGIIMAQ